MTDHVGGRLQRLGQAVAGELDRRIGWHRLPRFVGVPVLIGLRDRLRQHNLHDTDVQPASAPPTAPPMEPRWLTTRTPDGSHNDLARPTRGMAGTRFGRNIPLADSHPDPDPLTPNPREVSRALLTRRDHRLIEAPTVNALVAAWLQFMVRDWFSHGPGLPDRLWTVPLAEGDGFPGGTLTIPRTPPDPTQPADLGGHPPTWANQHTHWWDASQLYGSSAAEQAEVRAGEGGRLRVDPDGSLPVPADPDRDPSLVPGFWAGLGMLQTLFALEHNAICDRLRLEYPHWSDDELFERARLVNAALIAKIHATEWTPAVIDHPTTVAGMRISWWGLVGERARGLVGRIGDGELLTGIPGSATDHHSAPYAMTEEFVAVYRMHPLVPDDYDLRAVADDHRHAQVTLRDLSGPAGLRVLRDVPMADLLYSFGTQHPGLVTLHNFPRFLQEFERPKGGVVDLAATDILRTRELGVPRYNAFRRLFDLPPARDFDAIAPDARTAATMRELYAGDIDRVDLMIGMYGEPLPKGFAFSDTAFRIFLLMAPRRLSSDRFFTTDYTPRVYTQAGLDWIDRNTMATVLLRHHPSLRPALDVVNAFSPWSRARR